MHDAPPRAQLPVKVTISPRGLGRGRSAGLAFALEIYDEVSGIAWRKGRKIGGDRHDRPRGPRRARSAACGQKALGAARRNPDLVLVPDANFADGHAAAKGRIKVVAASSFRQALRALGAPAPAA